jgi:hypothetical protein
LLTVLRVVYAGTQKGHSRARKAILVLAWRSLWKSMKVDAAKSH